MTAPRQTLLLVAEDGFGKRILTSTLKRKGRGGMGVKVTTKPPLAAALMVREDDEPVIATRQGKIERIAVSDVPTYGREARGVRVMGLKDGRSGHRRSHRPSRGCDRPWPEISGL